MEAVDWLHQGVPSTHTAVPSQYVPKGRTDLKEKKSFNKRSSRPYPCLTGVTVHVQTGQVVHGSANKDSASLGFHPICTPKPFGFSPGCAALASWSISLGHVQIHIFSHGHVKGRQTSLPRGATGSKSQLLRNLRQEDS